MPMCGCLRGRNYCDPRDVSNGVDESHTVRGTQTGGREEGSMSRRGKGVCRFVSPGIPVPELIWKSNGFFVTRDTRLTINVVLGG